MDLYTYDFGKKEIWPKPEFKTPFQAMDWHCSLLRRLGELSTYAQIRGRSDHFAKDLDTLIFSLREALFEAMVLREEVFKPARTTAEAGGENG